ncbi:MAG TPA: sigma-54 dependent transcriptional regulator [Myxococcales bacterium]|nr:sigma-54 dependent transcriptional regulator [Myxococcales bacterium]
MANLLVIDDNETLREGMAVSLTRSGHAVTAAAGGAEGLVAAAKHRFDLVVTDLKMDGVDGMEVLRRLRAADPDAAVLMVTAFGTIETAVAAMREGALDFVTKPFSPEVLRAKVDKSLEVVRLRRETGELRQQTRSLQEVIAGRFEGLVGSSPAMQALGDAIRRVAASQTTVLILGESGTGKELAARAVHDLSPRRDGPFVTVNCAALAEGLLESELFGHERGSFTGAVRRKLGRFELASGGTIFLDEIGEVPVALQVKLLRILQEKEFQRVGGEETLSVDVRVVAATNRDLEAEVRAGRFREDLYYRLAIVPLSLPPLRDRAADVPELALHFLRKHAPRVNRRVKGISEAGLARLSAYPWPGNVRELENAIERALVFAEGELIEPAHLPDCARPPTGLGPALRSDRPLPDLLDDIERQLIGQAFEQAKGKKTETARLLGIKTSALYYKLEKYGFIERGGHGAEEPDR